MRHTFENTSFRFDKARISWRYGRNQSGAPQKEATGVNNPGAANRLTTLAPVFFFQVRATKNVKTEEGVPMFAASDSTRSRTRKARNACGTNLEKFPWVGERYSRECQRPRLSDWQALLLKWSDIFSPSVLVPSYAPTLFQFKMLVAIFLFVYKAVMKLCNRKALCKEMSAKVIQISIKLRFKR